MCRYQFWQWQPEIRQNWWCFGALKSAGLATVTSTSVRPLPKIKDPRPLPVRGSPLSPISVVRAQSERSVGRPRAPRSRWRVRCSVNVVASGLDAQWRPNKSSREASAHSSCPTGAERPIRNHRASRNLPLLIVVWGWGPGRASK